MNDHTVSEQTLGNSTGNKVRMTYTEFLDNSRMTSFLYLLLFGVILASILDGMDFQMTAFALPGIIGEFKINPAQAGVIASVTNVGLLVGAILFSLLSDRIGRKKIFQWVLLTFAFGSFLSAIAPSFELLIIARVIAGLGIGAELVVGAAILAEFAPRRYRHIFVASVPLVWSIGWLIAALLSIWCIPAWGWRSIYWIGVVPALMIAGIRFFLPESIRWLLIRGRTEEAGKIINNLAHRAGMTNIELVPPPVIVNQVKLNFRQQLSILRTVQVQMYVLAFVYFCFYIENWGINAWLPTIFVQQGYTLARSFTFTLVIFTVVPFSHLFGTWFQDKIQRKWAIFWMVSAGTVLLVLFGMSLQYRWPVHVIVGVQLLQTLAVQGVMVILYTLTTELFPTPVRSLGIGSVQSMGRFGAILGPFMLGLLLQFGTEISHIIYFFAAPLLVSAVLALFVIRFDPRQKTLEQINTEVEGEAVAAGGH